MFLQDSDRGHLLETLCYLHLLRSGGTVTYYSDSVECDFVVESAGPPRVVQACWELGPGNRARELAGLAAAAERLGVDRATIVTHAQREQATYAGVRVEVVPAWSWALAAQLDGAGGAA